MERKESPWELFRQFLIMGCCTFGGGWAIVAQIQREYVEKRKTLTPEELLDMTSVGRSIPGLMIGNISYLFGYRMAGFAGAFACLFGISLPSIVLLTAVTWCYTAVSGNVYVAHAMAGVRAAVVPIIFTAALKLRKSALINPFSYVVFAVEAILYIFFDISYVLLIIGGAVAGLVWYSLLRRKEIGHGAA